MIYLINIKRVTKDAFSTKLPTYGQKRIIMSAIITNIIKILNDNQNLIIHCYKSRDDLSCISEKLVDKINAYLKTKSDDEANQKDLIR
ncbi:hypothetical protein [Sulfurimonas sp.]|uniref:hypothetical protein n=1 Tax=Sulfurimonas sp. TaxID=2022749 RepID=UPI0025E9531B|nr:hypothetical protein [Sulfurimonas sp.]MCK9453858.1 hypothetical protein [Sulfurimonas sp.]